MYMNTAFDLTKMRHGTELLKRGFAKMQEGGVIMDVVTPEEAHIAEDAAQFQSWHWREFPQIFEPWEELRG